MARGPERERPRRFPAGRWFIAAGAAILAVATTAAVLGARFDTTQPPSSPARIAWFYRPPTDGTPPAKIVDRHAEIILTGRVDIRYRARLKAAGWDGDVWQYLEQPFTSAPLDGPCGTFPEQWELWENQVAWDHEAGVAGSNDFCRRIHENEDWLLHSSDGERLTRRYGTQTQYYMNPASEGWRDFFADRVEHAREEWGYDGLFLDDVWYDSAEGRFAELATSEAYKEAVVGFIDHLRDTVPGLRVIANAERPAAYAAELDGWLYEAFAAEWDGDYQQQDEIVELWALAERDAAAGKTIILVAQGERGDAARQAYAYAAYLMVAGPRVSFRYTNTRSYLELWDYPIYDVALGVPAGERRPVGPGAWMREFEAGAAVVNLSDERVRADVGTGFETSAGVASAQVDLPPRAGVILRRVAD